MRALPARVRPGRSRKEAGAPPLRPRAGSGGSAPEGADENRDPAPADRRRLIPGTSGARPRQGPPRLPLARVSGLPSCHFHDDLLAMRRSPTLTAVVALL